MCQAKNRHLSIFINYAILPLRLRRIGNLRKLCTKCGKKKAISQFSKNKKAKDGFMSQCSACNRDRASKYYSSKVGTPSQRQKATSTLYKTIKRRHEKGWTLKEIGEEVGLDESCISYYLSGKRRVGMKAVNKYKRLKNSRK
jgi:protein-arginine kinase activator protein McsA